MDQTQPFYYHIQDPLQNLSLKVTLRRIHGGLEESEKDGGKRKDKKPKSKSPTMVEKTLEWQEKVFGPREIAVLSPGEDDRKDLKSPRTPRSKVRRLREMATSKAETSKSTLRLARSSHKASSASSVTDSDYREQMLQRLRDGFDPLDELSEAMVFTYIDKDGFLPKSVMKPRLTTSHTDDDPTFNPLGLAAATLPLRQLPKGVLPQNSTAIKQHMSREAPFKVMYVMAAVDCDVENIKAGSLDKNDENIYGGPASVGGPR